MVDQFKTFGHQRGCILGDENLNQMGVERNPIRTLPTSVMGIFGEQIVSNLSPIFQGTFEYTVDNTRLTINTATGSGTITQATAMAFVGSGTTTTSSAQLQSLKHARYKSGQGAMSRFTAGFTSPVADTEQFIGLADESGSSEAFKNGLMIGYDGTTFGFHRFQNDVLITVAQADWNDPLDGSGKSGMTLDHTKLNVWQIQFQYLGAGAIVLSVEDDATGNFIEVCRVLYANIYTTPHVYMPNFHHTMWVDNGATTNDIILCSASYVFFVEGKTLLTQIHQPQFSTGTITKTTVTSEVPLVTVRCKVLYASKSNFIDVLLEGISASIEAGAANNLATLRLVKNATLEGASFVDINTTDSVTDFDSAATTVTAGEELMSVDLAGKNDRDFRNLIPFGITLTEGETITITAESENSATVKASLVWKELF